MLARTCLLVKNYRTKLLKMASKPRDLPSVHRLEGLTRYNIKSQRESCETTTVCLKNYSITVLCQVMDASERSPLA